MLDVQSARVDAFGEVDVATQQTVADQLAVAIGNSRLYRSARQRAERLAAVNRVSSAVGAVLDLDTLLEAVQREVTAVFQADAFFVALYDQRTDELDFRIQVDEGVREPPAREKVGAGFTSRVVREKRALLVRDVAAELAGLPAPLLYGTGQAAPHLGGGPDGRRRRAGRGDQRAGLRRPSLRRGGPPAARHHRRPGRGRDRERAALRRRAGGARRAPAHRAGAAGERGTVPQPGRAVAEHDLHPRQSALPLRQPALRADDGVAARTDLQPVVRLAARNRIGVP